MEAARKLSKRQLVAYGQLVTPLAVIGLPVAIYIPPFYSGTLGLDLAAVGFILMLARLGDVVTDPVIGALSDRTRTRWGRRRPWVAAGVPVMMLSAFMLFVPQGEVTNAYLLIWISAIYLGFTLIAIPYGAWGAELSGDYGERNRIAGAREIFLLLGLLMAITAPIVGAQLFEQDENSAGRGAMSVLGWIPLAMLPLCALIAFSSVPEPSVVEIERIPFRRGLRVVMRNGPFRLILWTTILGALAGSINAGVAILFFDHVAHLGKMGPILIFVLFATGVVGAPFWVVLGNRIGKHRGIATAGIVSLFAFAFVPAIIYGLRPVYPDAVLPALFFITLIQGFAMGAAPILGASILADVVDLDTLKSGEQRTAFIFAFLGMVRKVFEAAGVGIALPVLAWVGFNPQVKTNAPEALFTLTAMYCLVPLALWMISVAIIWQYPITKERQVRLRAALERRVARRNGASLGRRPAD